MRRLFNRTSTNRVSLADSMKNFCKQGVENRDFISTTYGGTLSLPSNNADQKKHKGRGSRLDKTEKIKFFEKVAVKNCIFIPTTYEEYFFKHKKEVAHE